jgi:hypothetical protein
MSYPPHPCTCCNRTTNRDAADKLVKHRPTSSSLKLKQCHATSSGSSPSDQWFQLIPAHVYGNHEHREEEEEKNQGRSFFFHLVHIQSGLKVGSEVSASTKKSADSISYDYDNLQSTLVLGNSSAPLLFTIASSRYQLFRIQLPHPDLFHSTSSPTSSEHLLPSYDQLCLVGGEFGQPISNAASWFKCEDSRTLHSPYQRWFLDVVSGEVEVEVEVGLMDDDQTSHVLEDDLQAHVNWLLKGTAHK